MCQQMKLEARHMKYLRRGVEILLDEARGEVLKALGDLAIQPLKNSTRISWAGKFREANTAMAKAREAFDIWNEIDPLPDSGAKEQKS